MTARSTASAADGAAPNPAPPKSGPAEGPEPAVANGQSGSYAAGDGQSGSYAAGDVSIAELLAAELAARHRRWPVLVLGLVLGAAAAYGIVTYLDRVEADEQATSEPVQLSTALVASRDLLEEVDWAGTLQYGRPIEVTGTAGTVTAATPVGTALGRGQAIASVDDQPVVLLYGPRPLWRTVEEGVVGVDVLMLETNLVNLGYDPDGTVSVDDEFTTNTGLMVQRWQTDIGREVTGRIEPSDAVMVSGPAVVTSAATVGSGVQGVLATISPDRTVTDVVSPATETGNGTVTEPVPVATVVEHGTVLYLLDDVAVVAVGSAKVEQDPVLEALADPTFSTLELEQALEAAGHDPDDEMTADGIVTDPTIAAVERWQASAGLPVSGAYDPGYYRLMPLGQTVDAVLVDDGSTAAARPILTTSNSELRVEVVVGVADADEFVEGLPVSIELADESTVEGVVAEIGAVERETPQSDPTVTVSIEVLAGSDQELVEGAVTVTSVSEAIEGALTVPTRALISLAEGGFAVEMVAGDGETRLVAVELGAFDDGYVQVVHGDVQVGDELVVPR